MLVPENSIENVPCIVNIIEENILRCKIIISQWNQYKNRKITVRVSSLLSIAFGKSEVCRVLIKVLSNELGL